MALKVEPWIRNLYLSDINYVGGVDPAKDELNNLRAKKKTYCNLSLT
jgi:hypothetical protein